MTDMRDLIRIVEATGGNSLLAPITVLNAGTHLFHGTKSAGDFSIPDGPAWFAYTEKVAGKWIDWSESMPNGRTKGEKRVLELVVMRDVPILNTRKAEDWFSLCKKLTGDADAGTYTVAHMLRDKAEGWLGRTEVLLCEPEKWLRLVV